MASPAVRHASGRRSGIGRGREPGRFSSAKRLAGIERFSLQALIAGVLSKLGKPRYNRVLFRGVAKLVKALDFDSSMRRFESFFPCQDMKAPVVYAAGAFSLCSMRICHLWRRACYRH